MAKAKSANLSLSHVHTFLHITHIIQDEGARRFISALSVIVMIIITVLLTILNECIIIMDIIDNIYTV